MKSDWESTTSTKDEIESLRQGLLDTQKALDKVSRPGLSNDVPMHTAAATSTVTKVTTETITPSPLTKSLDFRRFDSSRLLILRGGNSHVR